MSDEKPLKLGHLWILISSGFKKTFKNKFCILTTQNSINWYNKQEDHVGGRKGGSIKKLEECSIEETGERSIANLPELYCFTITTNKTHTLATETERERVNWIVEILKFRGIRGLVEMVNDKEQKLRRHAAYALCNLAGRSKDDTQIRIISENGMSALLECQKELTEPDLIDSINYSLCKLSAREENQGVLSQFFPHALSLITSDNERSIDFGLQTLRNCSVNKGAQEDILNCGGIDTVLNLLCKGEITKENLLSLASEILLNCTGNAKIRAKLTDALQQFVDAIPKFPPSAQELTVKILSKCMLKEDNSVNNTPVAVVLIPLLEATQEPLKLVVTDLLSKLSKHEPHTSETRTESALQSLLKNISSENQDLVLNSLFIIFDCWCIENHYMPLAEVGEGLLPLVQCLHSKTVKIIEIALEILDFLSCYEPSVDLLSRCNNLITQFLPQIISLQSIPNNSKITIPVLSSFVNFSKKDCVKIMMCKQTLLNELIIKIKNHHDKHRLLSNLIVLRNCCSMALGKLFTRLYNPIDFIESIELKDEQITTKIMEFLEYWTRAKRNREVISDKICSIVIESLKSFDSVQQVCCDVIRNISYDQPNKVVNSVPNLIQLLSSPTPPIVERSIIALRNCSEEVQARKRIQQSGLEKLISLLSSTYPPIVRASIQLLCTILSGEDKIKDEVAKLGLIKILIPFIEPKSTNLLPTVWLVSELYSSENCIKAFIDGKGIANLKNCIDTYGEVVTEISYDILDQSIKYLSESQLTQFLDTNVIHKCVQLCESSNWRLVSSLLSILFQACKIEKHKINLKNNVREFYRLLNSENEIIKERAAKLLIQLTLDENNRIKVEDLSGVENLIGSCKNQISEEHDIYLEFSISSPGSIKILTKSNKFLNLEYQQQSLHQTAKAVALAHFGSNKVEVQKSQEQSRKKYRKSTKSAADNQELITSSIKSTARERCHSFIFAKSKNPRNRSSNLSASNYRNRAEKFDRKLLYSTHQVRSLIQYKSFVDKYCSEKTSILRDSISMEIPKLIAQMEKRADYPKSVQTRSLPSESRLTVTAEGENFIIEYSNTEESYYPIIEAVQLLTPFRTDVSFGYFEVLILAAGKCSTIGVGVANEEHPLDQQPGWKEGSWGYHGDDGNKYWGTPEGFQNDFFGPTFTAGDIIGCGYNNVTQKLFFTKNGFVIDNIAFENICSNSLYPTIGLASPGEKILVNFGQIPFFWDLDIENTLVESIPAPKAEYNTPLDKKLLKKDSNFDTFLDFLFNKCGHSSHSLHRQ